MRRQFQPRWSIGLISPLLLGAALLAGGCAQEPQPKVGHWEGPQVAVRATTSDWSFQGHQGWKITSPHYVIYTTVTEPGYREMLPQVMEGGLTLYAQLVPGIKLTERPMDCYILADRSEWLAYTQQTTGPEGAIYMQIRRGGYTRGDRVVLYNIGLLGTMSVAAHEGFHQFVFRHFKGRLPPFLEEGLSCTFEGLDFKNSLPRWNTSVNQQRVHNLRLAIDNRFLWPLEELVSMHAGDVVDKMGERIDAYYSQSWAFGKFMREAGGGRYRPALEKWLRETADGTVFDPTHTHSRIGMPWNKMAVKPMLEHYLGMPFPEIEKAYLSYIHEIAYDEFSEQWGISGG